MSSKNLLMIESIKIINKLNRNTDSYYVNSELLDMETPNLLNSLKSVQRIILILTDS